MPRGPQFPSWLPSVIVLFLLGLAGLLVLRGEPVPAWLVGLTVTSVGAALGLDALTTRRRNGNNHA